MSLFVTQWKNSYLLHASELCGFASNPWNTSFSARDAAHWKCNRLEMCLSQNDSQNELINSVKKAKYFGTIWGDMGKMGKWHAQISLLIDAEEGIHGEKLCWMYVLSRTSIFGGAGYSDDLFSELYAYPKNCSPYLQYTDLSQYFSSETQFSLDPFSHPQFCNIALCVWTRNGSGLGSFVGPSSSIETTLLDWLDNRSAALLSGSFFPI